MAAGVLVVIGASYLIARALNGRGGGASSPEGAVQALSTSITKEDPAGAANAMAPEEVRTLSDLIGTVEGRARRTGLAHKGRTYSGLDIDITGLDLDVTKLSDDVARVDIMGGRAKYQVNRKGLSDQLQRAGVENSSDSISRKDLVIDTEVDGDNVEIEPFLITVKRGGGWYVSPMYTSAAILAEAAGLPEGDFDEEIPKDLKASESPEAAVTDLADSIEQLDPDETLAALPSGEWSVLHVYRRAIKQAIENAQNGATGFTFKVTDQDLDVSDLPGGYKKVTIKSASGRFQSTDESGDTTSSKWELSGLCVRVDGDDGNRTRDCLDDDTKQLLRQIDIREPFVVTEKDRGGWVVSPIATLLEYGNEVLPRLSDSWLYAASNLERVAPPNATAKVDEDTKVTLNDAGFAAVDIETHADQQIAFDWEGSDSIDDTEIYGPDGERVVSSFDSPSIDGTDSGTYRLVLKGKAGQRTNLRAATVRQENIPASGTVTGQLSREAPVVDYRFTIAADGSYEVQTDQQRDLSFSVYDDGGEQICYADSCDLTSGTTYRVRAQLQTRDDAPVKFNLIVAPKVAATVDGGSSVAGDASSGSGNHTISVSAGKAVTLDLVGDGSADLDLRVCNSRGACRVSDSTSPYESMTIYGPYEGTATVTDAGSGGYGGTYTLSIGEDAPGD